MYVLFKSAVEDINTDSISLFMKYWAGGPLPTETGTYLASQGVPLSICYAGTEFNFPTIPNLVFGSSSTTGWQTQLDLLAPSADAATTQAYLLSLFGELAVKYYEGYPVTIADVWARALSRHFVNGTTAANLLDSSLTHGAGVTLSSVAGL